MPTHMAVRALAVVLLVRAASAQCDPRWLPGDGIPGTDGAVHDVVSWDPDGPGPASPAIVVAGNFDLVGTTPAANIAMWDGSRWLPLGHGLNSDVNALAVLPDGRLVAGGVFTSSGSTPMRTAAVWNGASWQPIWTTTAGGGVVMDLFVADDGRLIAGGVFTQIGTVTARNIAAWDGAAWTGLGTGLGSASQPVRCVEQLATGEIIAGGDFTPISAGACNRVARWTGSTWITLGPGADSGVRDLARLSDGSLAAVGNFVSAAGANAATMARYQSEQWTSLGPNLPAVPSAIAEAPDGSIIAAGLFRDNTRPEIERIARLVAGAWEPLAHGIEGAASVNAVTVLPDGAVVVGGDFTGAGGLEARDVAVWEDESWHQLGRGTTVVAYDMLRLPSGEILAAGDLTDLQSVAAGFLGIWTGSSWRSVGHGLDQFSKPRAVALRPSGDIAVAGGAIATTSGIDWSHTLVWNGSGWTNPWPTSYPGSRTVHALATLPDGTLAAGGQFSTVFTGLDAHGLAGWNGSSWSAFGNNPGRSTTYDLAVSPDGSLWVGGNFGSSGLARWDGAAWSTFAGFLGDVNAIDVAPNGDVILGGAINEGITAWRSGQWISLAGGTIGTVKSLCAMPDGRLVASFDFTFIGGVSANFIAIWNGMAWEPLGSGLAPGLGGAAYATEMIAHPSGEIVVSGYFDSAGGQTSPRFARYTFTNIPWVALHPSPFTTTPASTVTLSATAATGYDNLAFQWQREATPGSNVWVNLTDGPGGASPGGGTVINSTGQVNGGQEILLSISSLALSDAGSYRCVVSNPCGQDESNPAALTITNPCPPDLTTTAIPGSPGYGLPNGTLNNDDFFYFLAAFAAGNVAVADLTTTAVPGSPGYGVPNGVIDNDDFFYYLTIFAAGC